MEAVLRGHRHGFSASALKYYAILAMVIDHLAWAFVPTYSVLGVLMHTVGRTVMPIMCYFLAEGYAHTRSVPRYALRLFLFALLSQFPFLYFELGPQYSYYPYASYNMIFALFFSLLAVWICDHVHSVLPRILLVFLICVLAYRCDWGSWAVLFTLAFWLHRGDFKKQCVWSVLVAVCMMLFQLALNYTGYSALPDAPAVPQIIMEWLHDYGFQFTVVLALPILRLYNGERGKGGAFGKWFFYIFYPAHLLLIGILLYGLPGVG